MLVAIRLIWSTHPQLQKSTKEKKGDIDKKAECVDSYKIIKFSFYFSILFIVLLQFACLIVGWDLNVWVLWDN